MGEKNIEGKFIWGDEKIPQQKAEIPKPEEITEREFDDYIKKMTNSTDLVQIGNYLEMMGQKENAKAMGFQIKYYRAGEEFYFKFKRNPNS